MRESLGKSLVKLSPVSNRPVAELVEPPSDKALRESLMGQLSGERVPRQVTARIAGRVAPYVEPPSSKVCPFQPGTASKREREETDHSLLA
jgi:hypothetical protein